MKSLPLFFAAGLLALAPLSALAKIQRTVEKTFDVQPGGLLSVETHGGNVRVDIGSGPTVKVVANQTIRTNSEQEADKLLEKLTLTIEQTGDGVSAYSKYDKRLGGVSWGPTPVTVDFVVTVPANYRVDLKTSGGNLTVGDLAGKVLARTSGGNITLGKISGDVDAHTSGGDVRLKEGLGSAKLQTSGGNILVDRVVGPTDVETSGGDIKIGEVENTLRASTSGGNVTAGIAGSLKGDCRLETSGGDVRVKIDRAAAFNLDASTSGGDVRADGLTITIDSGGVGRSKLSGKVNGGGPLLKLRTSGGNISVGLR